MHGQVRTFVVCSRARAPLIQIPILAVSSPAALTLHHTKSLDSVCRVCRRVHREAPTYVLVLFPTMNKPIRMAAMTLRSLTPSLRLI